MVTPAQIGATLDEATQFIGDPVGSLLGGTALFDGFDAYRAVLDRIQLPQDPPRTVARSSHGALLHATVGTRRGIVGMCYKLSFQQAVQTEDIFEIQPSSRGLPVDIVTQNLTTRTISASMFELNGRLFEDVFGTGADLTLLSEASVNLALREIERRPGGRYVHTYQYDGVRITNFGRSMNADDDRIVRVEVSFVWQRRRKLV